MKSWFILMVDLISKRYQAGLGIVIYFKQGKKKYRLRVNELIHQMDTNNEAEYAAFHYALNLLEELGVHPCAL